MAVHSSPHHRENECRTACPERLSDRARTLGALCRESPHPIGTANLCPRRLGEPLGRFGPHPLGRTPGFAIDGRNRHPVTPPVTPDIATRLQVHLPPVR